MRLPLAAFLLGGLAAASLPAQTPRPAPDFNIEMPGGKPLPLKSLRGKVVLLAFISTV